MPIENAIAAAEGLRDLLAQELARAETERRHVRALDADGLFSWAAARDHFHATALSLQDELAEALRTAGERHGLAEVRLETLAAIEPRQTERLAARLDEVRDLAARLQEADRTNQEIVARALDCVRGYTAALSPRTVAYDRRGHAVASPAGSTRHRST